MADSAALIEFLAMVDLSKALMKKIENKNLQNATFDPCLMLKGKSWSRMEKNPMQEFAS